MTGVTHSSEQHHSDQNAFLSTWRPLPAFTLRSGYAAEWGWRVANDAELLHKCSSRMALAQDFRTILGDGVEIAPLASHL
jgi:hypothetical protein